MTGRLAALQHCDRAVVLNIAIEKYTRAARHGTLASNPVRELHRQIFPCRRGATGGASPRVYR
jgi:hypothetical protein